MTLIAATKNKGKAAELTTILSAFGYEVLTLDQAGLGDCPDVPETGDTFLQNACQKAVGWQVHCKDCAVLADDSGLEVDALDGAPGVYSARYCEGDDKARRDKLLAALQDVPEQKRTARFVCAICLLTKDGQMITAQGACEGHIAFHEQGDKGFGYDNIFIETTTKKSFGELDSNEKDRLSHRGNALRALVQMIGESK